MDARLRSLVDDLRGMGSGVAADWLLDHHPDGSPHKHDAIAIIAHMSWARPDQVRLAEHFLKDLPFASAKPYEIFASFMQIHRLVEILTKNMPGEPSRKRLLAYHVVPVLTRAATTPRDLEAVQAFTSEVGPG